jgi:hypothetical protein
VSVRVEEKYPKINNKTGCERREEERETVGETKRRRERVRQEAWPRGDKKEERKRKVRGRACQMRKKKEVACQK